MVISRKKRKKENKCRYWFITVDSYEENLNVQMFFCLFLFCFEYFVGLESKGIGYEEREREREGGH